MIIKTFENVNKSDLAEKLDNLDPEQRYFVTVQAGIDRVRIVEQLDAVFAKQKTDSIVAEKNDDEIMDMVNKVIEENRGNTSKTKNF